MCISTLLLYTWVKQKKKEREKGVCESVNAVEIDKMCFK